ncbi:MAG: single-strand selective monofunctional uracil DNA glycosylase [Planctomycetota bacterium]|jgi:single-strand selective monofunctional uracil DNA glycosylase
MDPLRISRELSREVDKLEFADPVTNVYNPLDYAGQPWRTYLKRFARPGVEGLLLGMNPGPFGMAQTGVPFGEVEAVRDWLGIEGKVGRPADEHPKRPIQGFDCTRSEVSGRRLWGWAQERFDSPEAFFDRFFVWNFCPLIFLEESGRNRTPDKLSAEERSSLYAICDLALRRIVDFIKPERVIGIGKFAEKRAAIALGDNAPTITTILHPSPASPIANRGWAPQAEKQLLAMGITFD